MGAAVTDGHSGQKSDPSVAVLTPAAKGLTPMAVNMTPVVHGFDPSPRPSENFNFLWSTSFFCIKNARYISLEINI